MDASSITGEYYLQGVMETACGIYLKPDNTFQCFYIYGALDRHGWGTWKENGSGEIILNTDYGDAVPFSIATQEKRNEKGLTVVINNYNEIFLRNTEVMASYEKHDDIRGINTKKQFHFLKESPEKLTVVCVFFGDNPATILPDPSMNYIGLSVHESLIYMQFRNAVFTVKDNMITGMIPYISDRPCRFFR